MRFHYLQKLFHKYLKFFDMMKQQTLWLHHLQQRKKYSCKHIGTRYHKTCLDVLQNLMLAFHGSCHLVASVGK